MKFDDLQAIQADYCATKKEKEERLHAVWEPIVEAYRCTRTPLGMSLVDTVSGDPSIRFNARLVTVFSEHQIAHKLTTMMSVQDPEFHVTSTNPQDEAIAALIDNNFGQLLNKIKWNREYKKGTLQAVLTGTRVMKHSLSSEYVYGEAAWASTPSKRMKEKLGRDQYFPYGATTEYGRAEVRPGWPSVTCVPSTDIFFNFGARRWKDVGCIYHRQMRRLVDVMHDARYDDKAKEHLYNVTLLNQRNSARFRTLPANTYVDECIYTEVVERYDVASRQFCVFAPDAPYPLRDWTYFPLPIASPYSFWQPLEDPEYIWGLPPAFKIMGQAEAMNYLRAVMVDRVARDGKKVNLVPPWVDDDTLDAMNRAANGEFVRMNQEIPGDQEPVYTVEFSRANADVLNLMRMVQQDQDYMSGVTDAARNQTSRDATATEVSIRTQEQNSTINEFVRGNEEDQEEGAEKVMRIWIDQWPQERMMKITGQDPMVYFWVPVERERVLNADLGLQVVAGTSERQDKATVRRQWLDLMPRLLDLDMRHLQSLQWQQQGFQPLYNYQALAEYTADLFDPGLKRKLFTRVDFAELLVRLVEQHDMKPSNVSWQMLQQVEQLLSKRMLPGGGLGGGAPGAEAGESGPGEGGPMAAGAGGGQIVPFEARNRVPAGAGVANGAAMGQLGGQVTGRVMSEGMG